MRRVWRRFKLWVTHLFRTKPKPESPAGVLERPAIKPTPKPQEDYVVTADDIRRRTVFYYEALYHSMQIKPAYSKELEYAKKAVLKNKEIYMEAEIYTGVPWQLIGALHYRESNCNMNRQLLNGQLYYKRTSIEPKHKGPWKSWMDSTIFAFKYEPLKSTRLGDVLKYAERYNGMGYVRKGINSPYVWSYTTHYTKGKYVADGRYSPYAVSKQVGVAPLLKELGYGEEE